MRDPIGDFVDEFTAAVTPNLVRNMTCRQVEAIAGLLDEYGQPESARRLVVQHLPYCDWEFQHANYEIADKPIDHVAVRSEDSYSYLRAVKIRTYTVRARIHRGRSLHQTHAVVEVLTPKLSWTRLASFPPPLWFSDTPSPFVLSLDVSTVLGPVAERLIACARRILL